MWYKNLRLFRLQEAFSHSPEALSEALQSSAFTPCGKGDISRYGWVSPLGPDSDQLCHASNGMIAICAKKQEKILPAAVIKEQLEDRIRDIQSQEARSLSRKERNDLKDEITFSMIPQAFAKSSVHHAFISPRDRLLVVDAASANRAEELTSALRDALGSLKAIPLQPATPVPTTLTHWLSTGQTTDDFELGDECELLSGQDERIIRGKKFDLLDDQLTRHLENGMFVNKLAVHWKESLQCVIDDQFSIKRLKFADQLIEKAGDRNPETRAEQFDQEFAIMSLEIVAFINAALSAFGKDTETSP